MEINSINNFIEFYSKVRQRTNRVIQCIPEQNLNWTYKQEKFSLADQIRHIAAIERYLFAESIAGNKPIYQGCDEKYGKTLQEILTFFNQKHQESLEIFKSLKDEDLHNKCITPYNTEITIWKWMRALVEHEIHHRAQIYIYLNMLDVKTPPMFGLSSEELTLIGRKNVNNGKS